MNVPMLVVGASPAGLTTAILLARHGIESLVVERRPALSGLPHGLDQYAHHGAAALVGPGGGDPGGVEVEWTKWVGQTLAAAGDAHPTSFPTQEQSAVLSLTAPASVPQNHLEPVLLEYLRSFPTARVELGTEVVGVEGGSDGARVVLRDHDDRTRTVHARYPRRRRRRP